MPKYSICMCNYNMAATLKIALTSILEQLDERFEVVIVDDGSSDDSVAVIKSCQKDYNNLKLVELQRDKNRQLGFTRNKSIEAAAGEYVLLHLDCDDTIAPCLKDFVEIFAQIEKAIGKDFVLSGRPIQMGKRDFLLTQGPYRNIHRGEDRDMWGRFALRDAIIFLDNKNLKTVLPKTKMDRIYRAFYYTFDHLRNDFRADIDLKNFFYYEFFKQKNFDWKTRCVRLLMIGPALMSAFVKGPLKVEPTIESYEKFSEYKKENSGSFDQLMANYRAVSDWSKLSPLARNYF